MRSRSSTLVSVCSFQYVSVDLLYIKRQIRSYSNLPNILTVINRRRPTTTFRVAMVVFELERTVRLYTKRIQEFNTRHARATTNTNNYLLASRYHSQVRVRYTNSAASFYCFCTDAIVAIYWRQVSNKIYTADKWEYKNPIKSSFCP